MRNFPKTCLSILLCLTALFSLFGCQTFESGTSSSSLHNYENGVCTDCLAIQEGSKEANDLAINGCISSHAPTRYGTKSNLERQNAIVSEDSALALKGSFDSTNAEVYDGYQVWTIVKINLKKAFNGAVDLRQKALQFDVKKRNCGDNNSVYISTAMGIDTKEEAFSTASNETSLFYSVQAIEMAWTRVTINFSTLYNGNKYIHESESISLVFNNINQSTTSPSVFYLDNIAIIDAEACGTFPNIYNPEGAYAKTQPLSIRVIGNSFVNPYFSNSSGILQALCDENGANARVECTSIGNARISHQIEAAFGNSGYITNGTKHDVIFVQDFYGNEDFYDLSRFLSKLSNLSPNTEVKIYPGENESGDGERSAAFYELDLVDWKTAVKTLKFAHSFTSYNLNAYDGWHPNELSGFVGAIMMYMDLYGQTPTNESLLTIAQNYVWHYLPGETDAEKQASIQTILSVTTAQMA
ncbi:MAG: hypothetical protein J6D30_00975 [Clostridia bacterium]|nr:hypothetical protein [Clostridia bacterium]